MQNLRSNIDNLIESKYVKGTVKHVEISVEKIKSAIRFLKSGKHDGETGYYTDHLVHASDCLYVHLSLLFQTMIKHGFAPTGLLYAIIHPIPKNKRKSLTDSENYRGIALSSVLGKLLDWLILNDNRDILDTSNLQFGFKPDSSTIQCSFVVSECINYYQRRGSDVNLVLLDATKAFDRVQYVKLFSLLIKRGLCPLLCRLLLNMYVNQSVKVAWCDKKSEPFRCSNGVKQGGVLSPILFGVYIDELIVKLQSTGFGCHIGNKFVGAAGYADDIVLLAPTVTSMSKLLNICVSFSEEYDVLFNSTKSKLIIFSQRTNNYEVQVRLGSEVIQQVNCYNHLGTNLGFQVNETNMRDHIRKFNMEVNMVMSQFKHIYPTTRYSLFKTYCMSLYGCQLWNFSGKDVELFYTAWRKAIRYLWKLPYTCHSGLLHKICNDLDIEYQLHKRFFKFFYKIYHSKNDVVNFLAKIAHGGSRSAVADSLNYILSKHGISKLKFHTYSLHDLIESVYTTSEVQYDGCRTAYMIRELCQLRDGELVSQLSPTDCSIFINYLCTA